MKSDQPRAPWGPEPVGWQDDNLSRFMANSEANMKGVFRKDDGLWELLDLTETVYLDVVTSLDGTPHTGPMLFVMRSYSSFLGAARLLTSTQCVEVHLLLRNMLECCLYALYFRVHPDKLELWFRRHSGEEKARGRAQGASQIGAMLQHLDGVSEDLGSIARTYYSSTIDHGAHPNPRAMEGGYFYIEREDERPEVHHVATLVGNNTPYFHTTVLRFIEVSTLCIILVQLIFSEETARVDVEARLEELGETAVKLEVYLSNFL